MDFVLERLGLAASGPASVSRRRFAARQPRGETFAGDGAADLDRPRLLERMRQGVEGPFTVLTAPAGYGKTVLIRQWLARHTASPVASLTLHAADDAPRVAAQLRDAVATLADVEPFPPVVDDLLDWAFRDALAATLEAVGDAVLVVEDLDAPRDAALVTVLGRLLADVPPNVRVVVARRSWSPASLQRVLAARGTTTLDAAELAFTREETRALVRQLSGGDVAERQLDALVARAEGWPVALKVAAISMRTGVDADDVIDGLRGNEPHIAAFLREEVLDRQPRAVRRLLVRTSVLDLLDPALCRAVAAEPAAGMMLRFLERGSALTRRSIAGEELYVHHGLFRDVLRRELHATDPGVEQELLVRAATWHARHDAPERAAPYLIEAEEWGRLTDLIDAHGRRLFERGLARQMLEWLEAVPPASPRRHHVLLQQLLILSMIGETRRADQLTRELDARDTTSGERCVVNVLRAAWAFIDARPYAVLDACDAAFEALDGGVVRAFPDVLGLSSPRDLHLMAAGSRARAMWHLGDVAAAREQLVALLGQRNAGAYRPWVVHLFSALALLEAWAGNLDAARREAGQGMTVAATGGLLEHASAMDSFIAMAHVARERGDLRGADRLLARAGAIASHLRRPVTAAVLAVERALWHLARHEPERGLAVLRAVRSNGEAPPPPIVESRLQAAEVQLLLALGELDQALAVVDEAPQPFLPSFSSAAVQTAVARHDLVAARAHLARWAAPDGDPGARLERDLWTAIVDFEAGRRRQALDRGAAAVAAARREGRVRVFLDAGRPAERLLRAIVRAEPSRYVRGLVLASEANGAAAAPLGLSQREMEVVRYLPTPLSSAEIAQHLYISLNTLKTHLRTIYRKLGATSRRDAITRAEELGIA